MKNVLTKVFNKAVSFKPVKTVMDDIAVMDIAEKALYSVATVGKIGSAATAVLMLSLWGKSPEMDNALTAMYVGLASTYGGCAFLQGCVRSDKHDGMPLVVEPKKVFENLFHRVV